MDSFEWIMIIGLSLLIGFFGYIGVTGKIPFVRARRKPGKKESF